VFVENCILLPKGINEFVVFLCIVHVWFWFFPILLIFLLLVIKGQFFPRTKIMFQSAFFLFMACQLYNGDHSPNFFFNSTVSYTYSHCAGTVDYRTTGIFVWFWFFPILLIFLLLVIKGQFFPRTKIMFQSAFFFQLQKCSIKIFL
jgi:uncharacterized integral membrane protein